MKKKSLRFVIVGGSLSVAHFLLYTLMARLVNNNDLLWLTQGVTYVIIVFVAYFAHSRITWQDNHPTKAGVIKFFIWNFTSAIVISPFLTWVFEFPTWIYHFIYGITSAMHLPFDYEFVESTTIFVIVDILIMVLNYFFYDKFVFGKKGKDEK